jgi:hypothetical protein
MAGLSEGGLTRRLYFLAIGAAGAIQSFLFAFLIDLFTDIRWFLKKLVDGRKAKPQPHAARVIVWLRAPARVKIIAASILFPMRLPFARLC